MSDSWTDPLFIAGTFLSAFSAGVTASLSILAVPALLATAPSPVLVQAWRHIYDNGKVLGPSIAFAAAAAHLSNAYRVRSASASRSNYLIAAAVSTIAIGPYTAMFMVPTNDRLMSMGDKGGDIAGAVELVRYWGTLNMGRAVLPALGAVLGFMSRS